MNKDNRDTKLLVQFRGHICHYSALQKFIFTEQSRISEVIAIQPFIIFRVNCYGVRDDLSHHLSKIKNSALRPEMGSRRLYYKHQVRRPLKVSTWFREFLQTPTPISRVGYNGCQGESRDLV